VAPLVVCSAVLLWWLVLARVIDRCGTTDRTALRDATMREIVATWDPATAPTRELAWSQRQNPEWDLMRRTFGVLGLADVALADPRRAAEARAVIDEIVRDTLARDQARGQYQWLLPYARTGSFRDLEARSVFVDGEIALMLAVQQYVEPTDARADVLAARIDALIAALERGPIGSAESYPDECWTFCNTVALAAIRISDVALARDHAELLHGWADTARARLVDPATGLLVSSYTWEGTTLDGPEGSSLWMVAHDLLLVDPELAREQWEAARTQLVGEAFGFAWAREWPDAAPGHADVDSGPVVPLLDASAGSSGMLLLGAAAFDDEPLFASLRRTLELAAFPIDRDDRRSYAAATPVGDAVVFRALAHGALWRAIGAPERSR
jgi:hypothetical protein